MLQQVDEKQQNVSWKAIGYYGPDPDFIKLKMQQCKAKQLNVGGGGGGDKSSSAAAAATHSAALEKTDKAEEEEEVRFGPLYRRLLDMGKPKALIIETLQKVGFPVSIDHHVGSGKDTLCSSSPPPCLSISCDAVVVGSGSGGGVVAGVLAKAGYKVVVLEKGNNFARHSLSLLEGSSADKMYEGGGVIATDNVGALFLAGSTVGGGSAVNWSASIPTPSHVVGEWSNRYGLEMFRSKAYNQASDVVCERPLDFTFSSSSTWSPSLSPSFDPSGSA